MLTGQFIENWDENAWLQASDPDHEGEIDDVLQNHLRLPIFSHRLQHALTSAGIGGIQFLSVKVLRPDGEIIPGFAIANLLNIIPALNKDRTQFKVIKPSYAEEERILLYSKVCLYKQALEGYDIIRLKESKYKIYASERLKDIFEGGEFTGATFNPKVVELT